LPFSYATRRGRVLVKTYYAVPPDVLEDRDALLRWAREASAAGLTPLVEGL
jgi:TfoX/Sxy family transcriptional regulator of competence genes